MVLKVLTIIGARPQFIKIGAMSRAIKNWNRNNHNKIVEDIIIHTGQHFDHNMSDIFFTCLNIPEPIRNLKIHGGSHGVMTGRMMEALDPIIKEIKPDWVLVYGDTNSTLAAALSAIKLQVPIAHVEAGVRSFNMSMPEEVNRVLTDSVATLRLCPTNLAIENLRREGYTLGLHNVGDVMYDGFLYARNIAESQSDVLTRFLLKKAEYVVATCHRADNTNNPEKLVAILDALVEINQDLRVVLLLHPRTRNIINELNLEKKIENLLIIESVSYLDMVSLESSAKAIITDSGGIQKEAYFAHIPCITLRTETEWMETIHSGMNSLAPPLKSNIVAIVREVLLGYSQNLKPQNFVQYYGDGQACENIIKILLDTPPTLPNR